MKGFSLRTNGLFGFLFLVMVMVGIFFIAKGIFKILSIAAPVLILLTALINYRTLVSYGRFILALFKRSLLTGIVAVILSIIGFPILSGILFGKAILDRKVRKLQKEHQLQREGEFVEFEEVIRPRQNEEIELPPLQREMPPKKENRYEDLF